MTAATLSLRPAGLVAEVVRRQPQLAAYGFALLAIAALTALAQTVDGRLVGGVDVWVKPTKFLVSVGAFALTTAWFFGYVRTERRDARPMRAIVLTILIAGSFELLYIGFQAARGETSHFNDATLFHTIMYALMGLGAVSLVATTLPLAWEIARRPADGVAADFRTAVVIGLLLTFLLGGGLGGYMSAQAGHAVGPEGNGLPIFGWNRLGGDLRIAHFFGMHASQALPLVAWAVSQAAPARRWTMVIGTAVVWAAATHALFMQALAGQPLLPMF